jgi:dihydroflavonol-4-reductase
MTTALVLGGTGFIGGHVAKAALERGWTVRALRRRQGATGHLQEEEVEWFNGDINHPNTLEEAFQGVDVLFHAAGYYPTHSRKVPEQVAFAVKQIRSVLAVANQAALSRMVFTSTLTTIGAPPQVQSRLADERDMYLPGSSPKSAYYECKYAMESEVLRAAAQGMPAVVVNPTAVFGPGDVHLTLARLLIAVARGFLFAWVDAVINCVDVRDVASAQVRAAEVGKVGERYILGGHNRTLEELITEAAALVGKPGPRLKLSLELIDAVVWVEDHLPGISLTGNHLRTLREWQGYNCSKARQELNLVPRPLEETFLDAFAWLQAQGYL